jgi:hypothetical protein
MRFARYMLPAVLAVAALATRAAAPDTKTIVLECQPGWRATAVGQYGGVGFEVSCRNGRGHERLVGAVGTTYSVRVGVEGDVAADCFYPGDSPTVDVSCAVVRLTVR